MRIESKQEDRHGPKIDRSAGTFPGRVPLSTGVDPVALTLCCITPSGHPTSV